MSTRPWSRKVRRRLPTPKGVSGVSALRVRWSGHQLHADAAVQVDPAMTVEHAHRVAHRVEANLARALDALEMIHTRGDVVLEEGDEVSFEQAVQQRGPQGVASGVDEDVEMEL